MKQGTGILPTRTFSIEFLRTRAKSTTAPDDFCT